ncbi:diacylglycerol/lipid kinase family protein [Flavobacterium sp. LS1P3]|uniref:diacylglycerol/lipid kinase family protein n=1 Tax=Flavobacterium sp. LS1P3 TaxID=3401720 RepID=UPI003AAF607B
MSTKLISVILNTQKHSIKLTKEAIENKPNSIIACGDYGTRNGIASMLINTSIKFGIIPIGSGLASSLKIPIEITNALEVIKKGNTTCIDVGKINEYFFSIIQG